ncbi:MAG TPA: cysteine methyltransferase, partial [Streptomyces sp.]|nr:cysteine methyltransferase [Streptomyces sp.]
MEWSAVPGGTGPLLLAATRAGPVAAAFHARPAIRGEALGKLRTRLGTEPAEAPDSALPAE